MEKEKEAQLLFKLPANEAREFRAICVLNDTTISAVLRAAVKEYVEKHKQIAE